MVHGSKSAHPLTLKTHICRLVLLKPFISLGCEDLKHLKYEKNLFKCDYLIDYDYALWNAASTHHVKACQFTSAIIMLIHELVLWLG